MFYVTSIRSWQVWCSTVYLSGYCGYFEFSAQISGTLASNDVLVKEAYAFLAFPRLQCPMLAEKSENWIMGMDESCRREENTSVKDAVRLWSLTLLGPGLTGESQTLWFSRRTLGRGWAGVGLGGGMDFDMHSTSEFVQYAICTVMWLSFCRYQNSHSQALASPQIHFFGLWTLGFGLQRGAIFFPRDLVR